ncbi:MAG: hypothetical protein KKA73_30850 [Chloroflexi bacterium]|nr:hypothetical protein [Chloroflexota bacterium]
MANRFTIPRKMDFARKPYRGVTLRQLIYLALGAAAGGLVLLNGVGDLDLVARGAIALLILAAVLALAYVPFQGGHLDSWLPHALRFLLRPRLRVWRKTGPGELTGLGAPVGVEMAEPLVGELQPLAPAPPDVVVEQTQVSVLDRPLLPYGILVDLLVVGALTLATIVLVQGGYQALVAFLQRH